jgi:hypothetical protein
MQNQLNIDVATLDAPHRRALEEVIGRQLAAHQRLIISVLDAATPTVGAPRPTQTLENWTQVYDGLSDEEIEDIDNIAKTQAKLNRKLP